ncbi:ankyrin repeat domain-containing protein [Candidatus Neoehrlichia procyonis]|uniref:Ankyrin repeat family protein n=1 Tax=Candidatus Neoehrlichia procyonis str. RAC413 TaxID=1359163 RepID=A0A0F3NNM5_9RICK|nr:ankyrin repeat domain-containing protein [Candidatus Neoehrlichia lotoris]KJV69628.1 ankyrin repeat family protein [Candidatus Neoehrlichia lotoris str. RAC413]
MSLSLLVDSLNAKINDKKSRSIYEKIVRACNDDKSLVEKQIYVVKGASGLVFYKDEDDVVNDIIEKKNNMSAVEYVKSSQVIRCFLIHLPFIDNILNYDQLSDFCECLIDHGADINVYAAEGIVVQDKVIYEVDGKTPIAYAVENKNIQYVRYLLSLNSVDTKFTIKDIYDTHQGYNLIAYAIRLFVLDSKAGYYSLCCDMLKILDKLLSKVTIDYNNCDIGLRKNAVQIIKILRNTRDPGFNALIEYLVSEELLKVIELFIIGGELWKNEIQEEKSQCYKYKHCGNKKALHAVRRKKRVNNAYTSKSLTNVMLDYYSVSYNLIFSKYNRDGESLVSIAVFCGKLQLVKYLLENMSINPNTVNQYGHSLLHIAVAAKNSYECVNYLLNQGTSVSIAEYKFRATPLHIAASNGAVDIVKLILDKVPDAVYQVDVYGQNVLHYAARNVNSIEIFRLVKNLDVNNQVCDRALDYEYLKKLCNVYNVTQQEIREVIELKDNDIQQVGNTPLHIAIESNNFDVAKFLIQEKHCDVSIQNKAGYTALNSYSTCGKNTLLHQAVIKNDVQFVKHLLSYKDLDVNLCNGFNTTALKIAIDKKNMDMICTLLSDKRQDLFFGDAKISYIPLLMFTRSINDKIQKLILKKLRSRFIYYSLISLGVCLGKFVLMTSAALYCIFVYRDKLLSVASDNLWKLQVTLGTLTSLMLFLMFFSYFMVSILVFQLNEQKTIFPIVNQKYVNSVYNKSSCKLYKNNIGNVEQLSDYSGSLSQNLSELTSQKTSLQCSSTNSEDPSDPLSCNLYNYTIHTNMKNDKRKESLIEKESHRSKKSYYQEPTSAFLR